MVRVMSVKQRWLVAAKEKRGAKSLFMLKQDLGICYLEHPFSYRIFLVWFVRKNIQYRRHWL